MDKKDLVSYDHTQLQEEMAALGEPAYRAGQIFQWLHEKLADDFDEMTNLPKALRMRLKESYEICKMEPVAHQVSKKDGTEKFLFELDDGNQIESVLLRQDYGNTVCISSQAGCRMGCAFCASAIGGLMRNLTTSEMLRQVYVIQKILWERENGKAAQSEGGKETQSEGAPKCGSKDARISNVVVMGTGEPLDNYDNFVKFVRMISDESGLHISQRSITASTCGLVPGIRRLADENLQITLALSLHSAIQEKRESLMPVARRYALSEVLGACDQYFAKTGRRMTYEYSLMGGINDGEEDLRALIRLLGKKNCHLNLIPVNPVRERNFVKTGPEKALEIKNKLEKNGINVTIRKERGSDIDGACGQLRRRYAAGKEAS